MNRRVICAVVALAPAPAYADGLSVVGGSPRAIGRAGAATVGDDGGGALLINPAAMARRDTARGQVGVSVVDDSLEWQSDTAAAPLSKGQAPPQLAPLGAAIGAVGNWILGAGMMTTGASRRALPPPSEATDGLTSYYDYRYAGIAGSYRRDTLAIGAARRVGDSLAFGVSIGASQVRAREQRRIWAGFGERDAIGSFGVDVDLELDGTDWFCPSAVAGVLYAPGNTQIELGASVAWADTVNLDGALSAASGPRGPEIAYTFAPRSSLQVRQPLAVRAGGRYLGDRVVVELDSDLWIAPPGADAAAWRVHGVRVIDSSSKNLWVDLQTIPSRISQRTHVAVHGAVDVELIPGFLWATGGYAYANLGTPENRLSPSFGDLGGHTLGLGLETTAGGFTITLGWSRTWTPTTKAPSVLQLDNPFLAGDGPVMPGTYGGSLDQVGVLVEAELFAK